MGAGAYLEPLVVLFLLFGGTWINRSRDRPKTNWKHPISVAVDELWDGQGADFFDDDLLSIDSGGSRPGLPSLLLSHNSKWRERELNLFWFKKKVFSPDTTGFRARLLSRLLAKYPFLVECWYWALIYWVYQLGRAAVAVTLKQNTVDVARHHALQVIELEKRLHLFWELPIQRFFMAHPTVMLWINRIYSFIHIPGSIAFLVWLYYYSTTLNRGNHTLPTKDIPHGSPGGPALYQARRRTSAVCNLFAFIIFSAWPCMPPRLLDDNSSHQHGSSFTYDSANSTHFGFVDTVHGANGQLSVWTDNKFVNHFAAMPSLHFGYALLIGLSIATVPLAPRHAGAGRIVCLPLMHARMALPPWRRAMLVAGGVAYPLTILVAIVATANHFILDAVAGSVVLALAWRLNGVLLNLLPLEDWFLWFIRIHKPVERMDEYEVEKV